MNGYGWCPLCGPESKPYNQENKWYSKKGWCVREQCEWWLQSRCAISALAQYFIGLSIRQAEREKGAIIARAESALDQEEIKQWRAELDRYSKSFIAKVNQWPVGTRLRNAMRRALAIETEDYQRIPGSDDLVPVKIKPHLRCDPTFTSANGELLSYDEWRKHIIETPESILWPMNIGPKGAAEIRNALLKEER